MTERQARNLGLQINSRDNYHGLGKNLYIKVIANLDNPRVIFKNTINSKEFLILTMIKDNYNNNIIVPIEVETTTNSNNIKIDINRIKSVYGFDDLRGYDLNNYIKKNLSQNKFIKIYEKKSSNIEITSQLDLPINNISCTR